jgi:hypothetical protein
MLLDTDDPWGDLNTPSDSSAPKLDVLTKDKILCMNLGSVRPDAGLFMRRAI